MLLNGENIIKLGDLGFSKKMDKSHACSFLGTLAYMSPEVHNEKYYLNIDVWYYLLFPYLTNSRNEYNNILYS